MSHDNFLLLSLLCYMGDHIQKRIIYVSLIRRHSTDFFLEMPLMGFHLPESKRIFCFLQNRLLVIVLVIFTMLGSSFFHCFAELKCRNATEVRTTNQCFVVFENH